jgi:pyruvate dehydrogenase E1 component subunit alpha
MGNTGALNASVATDPGARALDVAAALYRQMARLRIVSARMVALQRAGKIAFHTASLGHEAAIVGATLAARDADWVFAGRREWGAALVRGLPIAAYVHHAFGTADDPALGHSPPDHPPARSVRVVPASGVPSAHLPQAVGCAWAARMKQHDVATLALFGDGIAESGDFHNAMNFGGVFKVPCVLVARDAGASDKSVAYGVASARVSGADALEVLALVRMALARAAEGRGPTLVEAATLPLGDDLADAELSEARVLDLGEADPVARLRRILERERLFDPAAEEALARDVRAELDVAVASAERRGPPAPSSIFRDVYAEVPAHLAAQAASLEP